jgi:hypothetical protein
MTILTATTRTGNYIHAKDATGAKALCGRKVKGTLGPVGADVETMSMDSDEVFITKAAVTCETCLGALAAK